MALIPYAHTDHGEIDASLLAAIQDSRGGALSEIYRMLLHSPEMTAGWVNVSNCVRFRSNIRRDTQEMMILLVAHLVGCDYVWQSHRPQALEAGVLEEDVEALRNWPAIESVSVDTNLLKFAGALSTRTPLAHYGLEQWIRETPPRLIVEAAMLTAYYVGTTHLVLALEIP